MLRHSPFVSHPDRRSWAESASAGSAGKALGQNVRALARHPHHQIAVHPLHASRETVCHGGGPQPYDVLQVSCWRMRE